jgi:CRP-like cAMP-binding protein
MHTANKFLTMLSPTDLALFSNDLRIVEMSQGQVLAEPHQPVEHLYFPHGGIVSYVVAMADGSMIETGMVGRDGMMGAVQALDDKVSPNKIMVQAPAQASVLNIEVMRRAIDASPSLRMMLAKHEQFFIAQIQQSAGCNATHSVPARMCRWLLRMHDLTGPELPLTQEFMAQMMGVRRTSVSLVAGELQDAGLIAYRRGHVRIVNLEKLREVSCECYEAVNTHYTKIFQTSPPTHNHFYAEVTSTGSRLKLETAKGGI